MSLEKARLLADKAIENSLNRVCGQIIHVNEILSYNEEANGDLHIHLENLDISHVEKEALVEDGLRKLALMMLDNPKIQKITAISWIVAMHPRTIKKMGFTIEGPISKKTRDLYFKNEERPISKAVMYREDFLNKYGPKNNEVSFNKLLDIQGGKKGKYFDVRMPISNSALVVKESLTKWRENSPPGTYKVNDLKQIKQDLKYLEENFREFIPKSQLVLGKNEKGEIVTYIVQERIEGENMEEPYYMESAQQQLRIFFKKVVDVYIKNIHYKNKETEPESILPDIQVSNFIFGISKKDYTRRPKLYFTDTYPLLRITPDRFLNFLLPLIVQRAPIQWQKACEEFRQDAENRVSKYLISHSKK